MLFRIWMGSLGHPLLIANNNTTSLHSLADLWGEFADSESEQRRICGGHTHARAHAHTNIHTRTHTHTHRQKHSNWRLCFGHLFIISLNGELSYPPLAILLHPHTYCALWVFRVFVFVCLCACMLYIISVLKPMYLSVPGVYALNVLCTLCWNYAWFLLFFYIWDMEQAVHASHHSLILCQNAFQVMNFNHLCRISKTCLHSVISYAFLTNWMINLRWTAWKHTTLQPHHWYISHKSLDNLSDFLWETGHKVLIYLAT